MKELIDKIIITLIYYKKNGKDNFVSLKQLINLFDETINYEDVFNIAKYIETQGYIKAIYVLGDVLVKISTLGQLKYEDNFETLIDKYISHITNGELRENLDKVANEVEEESIKKSRKNIAKLITEIKNDIEKSKENGKRNEYINSLRIIELALNSESINTEILASAFNTLFECNVVPHKIRELGVLLNLGIV
jgi:predicted DNA-binding protein (UPF0278 family)